MHGDGDCPDCDTGPATLPGTVHKLSARHRSPDQANCRRAPGGAVDGVEDAAGGAVAGVDEVVQDRLRLGLGEPQLLADVLDGAGYVVDPDSGLRLDRGEGAVDVGVVEEGAHRVGVMA